MLGGTGDDEETQAEDLSTSIAAVSVGSHDKPQHVSDSGKLTIYVGSGRYSLMPTMHSVHAERGCFTDIEFHAN